MSAHLIAGDIRHIQDYIFASARLFEMRGASLIIDFFDRSVVRHLVEAARPHGAPLQYHGNLVFSGGGNFLASFPEATPDAVVDGFIEDVRLAFLDLTGGLDITLVRHPYDSTLVPFHAAVDALHRELRQVKRDALMLVPLAHMPFLKHCESCGRSTADQEVRDPKEHSAWVCTACARKRLMYRDLRTPNSRASFYCAATVADVALPIPVVTEGLAHRGLPRDFEGIGTAESGPSSSRELGFIVADANGMAEWFRDLDETAYREQSEAVEAALRRAIDKAVESVFPEEWSDPKKLVPVQVLICGGDDILAVVSAPKALLFATALLRGFDVTRIRTQEPAGMAAGVLLCKEGFPFRQAHSLAAELLSRAKRRCRETDGAPIRHALDFHRVTASMVRSLEAERSALRAEDSAQLRQWSYGAAGPYSMDEMDELLALARRLGRVPPSQRGLLRTILSPDDEGEGTAIDPVRCVPTRALEQLARWVDRQTEAPFGRKDIPNLIRSGWSERDPTIKEGVFKLSDALMLADVMEH